MPTNPPSSPSGQPPASAGAPVLLLLQGQSRLRQARPTAASWFTHLQLWQPTADDAIETATEETVAVLLRGTFDLQGGPTSWPARGARTSPLQGRPMAVFLPPQTRLRASNGSGEILLLSARQPAAAPIASGREVFAHKPLLPLAGSGKSFDPSSGEWRPAETFPDAAESLPPRRMERLTVGTATIERVLAPDYKAATLCIDETVLPAGATFDLASIPGRPPHAELLVFVHSEAPVTCGPLLLPPGGAAALCPTPGGQLNLQLQTGNAPAYILLGYAGKQPAAAPTR